MAMMPPMAVVEMPDFLSRAKAILTEAERTALVAHLGANPEAGRLVPETGGVRKLRWGARGQGKRGGARVIYYYYNESIPVFALDIYAKNQKANLSATEKKAARKTVAAIRDEYDRRK
jgi:hypothetical protein